MSRFLAMYGRLRWKVIVGFDGASDILGSARAQGLCHRMELTKSYPEISDPHQEAYNYI